jgi:hypothetical protein
VENYRGFLNVCARACRVRRLALAQLRIDIAMQHARSARRKKFLENARFFFARGSFAPSRGMIARDSRVFARRFE